MFVSVVARQDKTEIFPDVLGVRVLMTGLSSRSGVDVARAFAEHKAQLVLQSEDESPEFHALVPVLAGEAAETNLYNDKIASDEAAVRLTQKAAQLYGGLDVVINLIPVTFDGVSEDADLDDIEEFVSKALINATMITRVAANRMRLTWSEGLILNVVTMPAPRTAAEAALAGMVRATLATMTRNEADTWSDDAIRVNAVGPRALMKTPTDGACLTSDADIASLALYLAGRYGRHLTGHVFDAEGVAKGR